MTDQPNVIQAISAVMADVQAVRKKDRNEQQRFMFRGIDAVINAVGPALRKHGVVAVPVSAVPAFEKYQSKSGAEMRNTTITVTFRFYGPAGDHIEAQTIGEASDAGDKSVSKAHSVAYRTLLLQALCIPTDEPDPDASTHERGGRPEAKPEPKFDEDQHNSYMLAIDAAETVEALNKVGGAIAKAEMPSDARQTLRAAFSERMATIRKAAA